MVREQKNLYVDVPVFCPHCKQEIDTVQISLTVESEQRGLAVEHDAAVNEKGERVARHRFIGSPVQPPVPTREEIMQHVTPPTGRTRHIKK